ncbi:MAG: ion transporter [Lachnospira eligens]
MRKRIFEIIEVSEDNDKYSKIYDAFMMITICISIFPLAFKNQTGLFNTIDKVAAFIFIVDYILRLSTADYKLKKGVISFAMYPFSFMAIVDLLSILPSVIIVNNSLKLLKIFRFLELYGCFEF